MLDNNPLTNQEKLDEMYELTLENHEILRSLRRNERIANTFRFIYWLIVLGALGGVYYYVSPVINSIAQNKDKIESTFQQMNEMTSMLPEKRAWDAFMDFMKKGNVPGATSTNQ